MRKALFFDIDGTLLSDVTGKIPDSAIEALKKNHRTWKYHIYQHRKVLLQRTGGTEKSTLFRIPVRLWYLPYGRR